MSTTGASPEDADEDPFDPEVLTGIEAWWRNQQLWLKDSGYMLRPRYRADWVPSWRGTNKVWIECEDGRVAINSTALDGVRISDGKLVALKQVDTKLHPFEVELQKFLTSGALSSDPDNHCVPLYEVLQVPSEPDTVVLVMPYLRDYDSPPMETFGEAVEFFRQALTGMQFMHRHGLAHRDGHHGNLMYDAGPLFPEGYHPVPVYNDRKPDFTGRAKRYTRTQVPPKYYWIDFGISRKYDPESLTPPAELPIWGGDRTVPEFQASNGEHNPFPTDVYYVGNLIKTGFIDNFNGFSFMQLLVSDMRQEDPSKRPTMDQVVARFDEIRRSLSQWKLRSRIVRKDESYLSRIFRGSVHIFRSAQYILTRKPAVPVP